jgi:hypothetical protein
MSTRLLAVAAREFDLIIDVACGPARRWARLSSSWSGDARPGDWIRMRLMWDPMTCMPKAPIGPGLDARSPEGMVIAVLGPWRIWPDESKRFLALMF